MRPDQTLLVAKRPEGKSMAGLWELPGGKIETGETSATTPLTFASHAYDNFHLVMPVFLIREWDGEPVAQEGQTLSFVAPGELKTLPAPAADIPLFNFIEDYADRGGFA